jgi:hypothetical protein
MSERREGLRIVYWKITKHKADGRIEFIFWRKGDRSDAILATVRDQDEMKGEIAAITGMQRFDMKGVLE